jgi:hypothetical protein
MASRLEVHWVEGVDSRDFPALGADILWVETKAAAEFFCPRSAEFYTADLGTNSFYALWTPVAWAGDIDTLRLASLTVSALARPAGTRSSREAPETISTTADLWFDEEDPSARELAAGLAGSVSPTRVVHGTRSDRLWKAVSSGAGHAGEKAFVLRYDSLSEARSFHSDGVVHGLISTYLILVARRAVTGVGKTGTGGVDLSMARVVSLVENSP